MAIRLMLADDHRMLREGLRRSMTEHGFEVVGEASDGAEAVDMAQGADTFVAGSAIFGQADYAAVIARMRERIAGRGG